MMESDNKKSTDLTSPNYDALRALYSTRVPLPRPDAPILDNITKFVKEHGDIKIKAVNTGNPKVHDGEPSQPSTSRFLPHQEPVAGRGKRSRDARTVLTRMNSAKGPLAMLTRCMEQRVRLKVVTRNMAGLRGHCLGFLVAFDKQFNLAMEDVTEVWTRRRRPKTAPMGAAEDIDVPVPRVRILEQNAKTETCERHLKKLLMRGEHVVMVCATDF